MGKIAGRLGRLALSKDGGVVYWPLECVTDMDMAGSQEELDATCKSDGPYKTYILGRKEASLNISGRWNEDDYGLELLEQAFFDAVEMFFRFRMEEASGAREFIARGIVTEYSPSSPNDGIAEYSATVRLSGDFGPTFQA